MEARTKALQNRQWFLVSGTLTLILGILAISVPFLSSLVFYTGIGAIFYVIGLIQTIHASWSRKWAGFYFESLGGVLYLLVGMVLLGNPGAGVDRALRPDDQLAAPDHAPQVADRIDGGDLRSDPDHPVRPRVLRARHPAPGGPAGGGRHRGDHRRRALCLVAESGLDQADAGPVHHPAGSPQHVGIGANQRDAAAGAGRQDR